MPAPCLIPPGEVLRLLQRYIVGTLKWEGHDYEALYTINGVIVRDPEPGIKPAHTLSTAKIP